MNIPPQVSTTFVLGMLTTLGLVSDICFGADAASAEPVTAEPEQYTLEHCVLAAAHTGGPDPAHLLDLEAWNDLVPGVNWKEMLREGDDKETLAALRLNTQTGRPLAHDSFLSKLEATLGRRLRPLPVGRPKKQQSETRKRRK